MIDQKIIINLKIKDSDNDFGKLFISARSKLNRAIPETDHGHITLENVPEVDKPDDETPIQYNKKNPVDPGARIMLLEETPYEIMFIPEVVYEGEPFFPTIMRENDNNNLIFTRLTLSDGDSNLLHGTLNFHSYVGKSFFDVQIGNKRSQSFPFEVRSKKIDYQDQYRAMISDLSEASSSLLLEPGAPLYQIFDFDERDRKTVYEDFMFLEYIFSPGNFPQDYEYIRKNIYNRLEKKEDNVPIFMSGPLGSSDLINIISDPSKLIRMEEPFPSWPEEMQGYIPVEVRREYHEETIDTPENRLLKYLLCSLETLIDKIRKSADSGYILDKIKLFDADIKDYLSDDWINDVGDMKYVPTNSQVLQKREGYRNIFQYFLNFEFAFRMQWVEMEDLLKGYNRRLSELYEYWCYFKMVNVLSGITGEKKKLDDLFEKIDGNTWKLKVKKGESSVQKFHYSRDGKKANLFLIYNKRFSRKTRYPSYSLPFKPDYSILIDSESAKKFIHFDAKYRSEGEVMEFYDKIGNEPLKHPNDTEESLIEDYDSREEDEIQKRDKDEESLKKYKDGDIYKMHTYKDAILMTEGAYILYPGDKNKIFKVKSDSEIPSVGAFPLTPGKEGKEDEELKSFIIAILNKLMND